VPSAHANAPMARNLGRSLSVVMSLMITVVRVRHPPPPRPWTTRAATSQFIFSAHPHRTLPSKNREIANIITHFQPLIDD
jgi:hypothetical protein